MFSYQMDNERVHKGKEGGGECSFRENQEKRGEELQWGGDGVPALKRTVKKGKLYFY